MVRQKAARWPCGVCNKGVGSNSLQCTRCQKWVHKKCSGIKGSRVALFHETERNGTKPDETERLLSSNALQKCIK